MIDLRPTESKLARHSRGHHWLWSWTPFVALILISCGGGGSSSNSGSSAPQSFQISSNALAPATISAGTSAATTLTVTAVNGFTGSVSLACTGLPAAATCSFKPASVTGSGTSQLTVTTRTTIIPGRYPFTLSGSSSGTSQSAAVILGVAQQNGTISSTYFSIIGHQIGDPPWIQVAPFGAFRFWDTNTQWNDLQPTDGPFNWSRLDTWMSQLQSNGITRAAFTLSGTARWASSDPNDVNASCDYSFPDEPSTDGYCAPPSDLNSDGSGPDQYWKNWVAAVTQHLQLDGKADGITIDAYEPWNEFTRTPDNSADSVSWEGTDAQLVRMIQDARCIIKGNLGGSTATEASSGQTCAEVLKTVNLTAPVDPKALFLSPSSGISANAGYQKFWDAYMTTPGATDAADGFAFHLYDGNPTLPIETGLLANLLIFESDPSVVTGVQQGKPIWATEGSWAANSNLPGADDQAAYVARDYLLLFSAANVQRFYWYALDEICETAGCSPLSGVGTLFIPPDTSNCTTPNGCVLSGGIAYGQVYSWMTGAVQSAPCNVLKGSVWSCGFTRAAPHGYQAEAIWDISQTCTPSCTASSQTVPSIYVQYRDLAGDVHPIANHTVPVGERPILLENTTQ
ncbi:MAG TPA: hypothetical protein VF753_07995 [Terriglobales bacterium]